MEPPVHGWVWWGGGWVKIQAIPNKIREVATLRVTLVRCQMPPLPRCLLREIYDTGYYRMHFKDEENVIPKAICELL